MLTKGELLLWGGECYGDSTVCDFGPDGFLRAAANVKKPRPCRMITEKSGKRKMGDYIEAFSFVRMNRGIDLLLIMSHSLWRHC